MSSARTCLIVNPSAGRKVGVTTNSFGVDEARDLLTRHGIDAEIWCTERPGHATELARKAADEQYDLVIAAGGDGTVEEVAEGLVGTAIRLGVLPLGSVMNIARMLGIPRDLEAAAEVIKAGRVAQIDVGRATTTAKSAYFIEAAGIGIDAGLFAYFNQIDSGNWRSLRPLVTFMWRYRPRRVTLRIDGRVYRYRAMMVTIANGPYVGAALTVAPEAQLDDHLFDVEVFTRFGKFELLRHLLSIAWGRRKYNPKVQHFQAKTVEVIPDTPMMVHADSDPLATTPARFEVLPAALAVIVGAEPGCLPALLKVPPLADEQPLPSTEAADAHVGSPPPPAAATASTPVVA